ncbi:MAG: hypothetical protein ACI4AK_09655 [Lepagella sp.]
MTKNFKSFMTLAVAVVFLGVSTLSSCSGKSNSGNDSTAVEAPEDNDAVADSIAQAISEIQPDFNEDLPFSQLASAATVLSKYNDIASKTVNDSIRAYVDSFIDVVKNKPIKFESTSAAGVEFEEAYISNIYVEPVQVNVSIHYKSNLKENLDLVVLSVDKDNKIVTIRPDIIQPLQIYHHYAQGEKDANVVKFVVCTPDEAKGKKQGDPLPF